jgi:superfamily II RNA helicase
MNPPAATSDSPQATSAAAERAPLSDFLPPPGAAVTADELFDRFLGWVSAQELELYAAQEEALLELWAGRHVVLATPTGSGKSLVALGLQFKAAAEGRRSYYTTPIKALASEKFFALCALFGAERVGMLTGDASINPGAPVMCCTAEVLSNMALRQGDVEAPYVVMDEFHYYGDAERGVAWQVPLLMLPNTQFLLMSATLGNTAFIEEDLARRSGREVVKVSSDQRPVPLEFEYRETALHETLQELHGNGRLPGYVVNFTQRECAELAQALTSMQLTTREERERIRAAIGDFRFDTPYGKEIRRFLGFGVGIHHAGLLPKYRLLVEQLAQQGLLPVICGTDTLGVGVNIPIRTVIFNKLAKYDGKKVALLPVRDFKQIAGRAGRKGFDDRGWVVAQAPEHVIEVRRQEGKKKKVGKAPPKGEVQWNADTFDRLVRQPPEPLKSSFKLTHGMVLDLLQRDGELDDPGLDNFWSLREVIRRCHEDEASKRRLVRQAAELVRSLHRTGVVKLSRDSRSRYLWVVVDAELQREFSLHQTLSLFMLEAIGRLEEQVAEGREPAEHVLDLLSVVESVLEDPEAILRRQVDKLKDELVARMKAEGIEYEERMERLQEVTHPKPAADFLYATFDDFRRQHPWVRGSVVRPKSIGRDLLERYLSFGDYVRFYGLQRSEGVLLRYLSQLYRTLQHSVPERSISEPVVEVIAFFRTLLEHTDTSLLDEWESLLHPELRAQRADERQRAREELRARELLLDPRAFLARVRAELHQLVGALARGEWEEAAAALRAEGEAWPPERLEAAMAPLLADYRRLDFTPRARQAHLTEVRETEPRRWEVTHNLLDPEGEGSWHVLATVDLRGAHAAEGPLLRLQAIQP